MTQEEAAKKLQAFLEKEGMALEAAPVFIQRDDGTFSVQVRLGVTVKEKADKPTDK